MTRYLFGGGGDGDIIRTTGLPYTNSLANVYTSRTGGALVTDLQTVSGATITQVTTDAFGQAIFYGPDNYIATLWLDFGGGSPRWGVSPKDVDQAATRAITVQRTADAAAPAFTPRALLPYNTTQPLGQALATKLDSLVIPRFPSQSARDSAFPIPVNGDRCWRTDLSVDQVYDGTVWQSLTPVSSWMSGTYSIVDEGGTFQLGNGSKGLRYQIQGKSVQFYLWLTLGSSTVIGSGLWNFTGFPWTIAPASSNVCEFPGQALTSAGRFPVFAQQGTDTLMALWSPTSTTNPRLIQFGATPVPGGGGWNSGNFIRLGGTIELA